MERRKLFSEPSRRKLFSSPGEQEKVVRCRDCGYILTTTAATTDLVCPKCGGTRFNVESEATEKEFSTRRKLFSDTPVSDSPLELKLKEFSGKILSEEEYEKTFSEDASALKEKGFAETCESGIMISDTAYFAEHLFSGITITISRELDLDKDIVSGKTNKTEVIKGLEERDGLAPKGIILIKKAHGIDPTPEHNSWIEDSGISHDVPYEFGGTNKDLLEFRKALDERYPDAPENIIDLLKERGIIKVSDGNVEIIK